MPALATRICPVETREELLYLLTRASELEHDLACSYLYAGYSIKSQPGEGGLTFDEHVGVRRWKQKIAQVAVEEMLHLAQVSNILTAVGGAPHFVRGTFPLPASTFPFGIEISLEPLSQALIERFVCYEMPHEGVLSAQEMAQFDEIRHRQVVDEDRIELARQQNAIEPFDIDFRTVGEFYKKIESAFKCDNADRLFIGDPAVQANPCYLDLPKELVQVVDADSACRAIDMIVEQGESPTASHPGAHFVVFNEIRRELEVLSLQAEREGRIFDPFRPMLSNPSTRGSRDFAGTNRITDPVAQELAELFNGVYDLMLMMLVRFFAHGGETEEEMRLLARGTLRMMASGLRPLGEALARTPAGPEYPGKTAGPTFGIARSVHLLPHKEAAWIFFLERLYDLATRLTRLGEEASLPQEVPEAAAAMESVAEHLTPFIPAKFSMTVRSDADERNTRTTIRAEVDGPYIVRNLRKLTNSLGESLAVRPIVALCRCGGSKLKPYCDGTHATNGFCGAKSPDRTPDRADTYVGQEIVVLDNRGTCCHFGNCTNQEPKVFHNASEPFVTADGDDADKTVAIVRECPSGALGFTKDGVNYHGEDREQEIYVAHNASYYVRGGIELEGEAMNKGASREHYALCRCGHSKNKPFCDGSHWYAGFKDDDN